MSEAVKITVGKGKCSQIYLKQYSLQSFLESDEP